jgi:hypothetical protein
MSSFSRMGMAGEEQEAASFAGLEWPLTMAAARLSEWVYRLDEPLEEECLGPWLLRYEVRRCIEADDLGEDTQKAIVAVTLAWSSEEEPPLAALPCRVMVMVFRGTERGQDWLQNIACVPNRRRFRAYGIGAHSGMLTLVENDLHNNAAEFFEVLASEAEMGTSLLLITGHSLGGALASIFQLLMRLVQEHPDEVPDEARFVERLPSCAKNLLSSLRAIGFGAPMVFVPPATGVEVTTHVFDRCTTVVHNNDVIPRLPSQLDFLQAVLRNCGRVRVGLAGGLAGMEADPASVVSTLASQIPVLSQYRHLGRILLARADGTWSTSTADGGQDLLSELQDPTDGAGIKNWWSGGAYDAGRDHSMERYCGAVMEFLPRALQADALMGSCCSGAMAVKADALTGTCSSAAMDLMKRSMQDAGAESLACVLNLHASVTSMDLRCNSIGPSGAQALAAALKSNQCLTSVNLASNSIGDSGAQALAATLKVNQCLTSMHLGSNSIGVSGALALAAALKENSCLTLLGLGDNSVGDSGAKALTAALTENRCLTFMDLHLNSIGDSGAEALAAALKVNRCLTSMDLGHNSIGDRGAEALAATLKVNRCLISVHLWGNSFEESVAKAASMAIKVNRYRSSDWAEAEVPGVGHARPRRRLWALLKGQCAAVRKAPQPL